ncbi:MAG: ATP phosphoribosyltransferase [Bacteroidota bacterium]
MLKLVLPKGRIQVAVQAALAECGITLSGAERTYRPSVNVDGIQVKLLKSQNIPPLLALGQHDCGFAGADWVREQRADVVELLDLGFDPVKIVAAVPEDQDWDALRQRPIIAVSEYRRLTTDWLESLGTDFTFVRSYGATEVFPPEDADLVVDNTATGATLRANRLKIVATIMESTTRFLANAAALDDPEKRESIENLVVLLRGVLASRKRVLLEMNASPEALDTVVSLLPAMKAPTVSKLYQEDGFAVRAAVPMSAVRTLVPELLAAGATDILELPIRKIIPGVAPGVAGSEFKVQGSQAEAPETTAAPEASGESVPNLADLDGGEVLSPPPAITA